MTLRELCDTNAIPFSFRAPLRPVHTVTERADDDWVLCVTEEHPSPFRVSLAHPHLRDYELVPTPTTVANAARIDRASRTDD